MFLPTRSSLRLRARCAASAARLCLTGPHEPRACARSFRFLSYLTALLLQAPGGAMPTTKEAVLRLFVAEHERGGERAEALRAALSGHHAEVLMALAVEATRTANTAIS